MDHYTKVKILLLLELIVLQSNTLLALVYLYHLRLRSRNVRRNTAEKTWNIIAKMPDQLSQLRRYTKVSNTNCIDNLRMDRNAFCRLCYLLENFGGLTHERFISIPMKVAMFLNILAHHKKNRVVKGDFQVSGHTVSKYFKETLYALLRLGSMLLIEPAPIPNSCSIEPWKYFKGCLGALDGTYIEVIVRQNVQQKYRTRKGHVAVNVLGVCNPDMNFIYVLAGWEGSAADSRILRDAVTRPNGLRVPAGNYYLADCGYTNADGFLTPYRGTRYHLKEFGTGNLAPQTPRELFNLRHSRARNVIERAFALLKGRWAILRSRAWYPIKVQNLTILACAMLHNFIRTQMTVDPDEERILREAREHEGDDREYIGTIEPTPAWTNLRDNMATEMFQNLHNH